MKFKTKLDGSLLARNTIQILLLFTVAFFTQLLFIDGSNYLLAGEKRKTFDERFPPKRAPMTPFEEAEARKLLKSGRPITNLRKGVVTADTFHTAGSTYDYGWNGLSRQMIFTDSQGTQHIAFHRRTTLSSAATRRIYYQYEIDDDSVQVGVDVTPLGQGSGWPSIDVTSDGRAVLNWHSGLVERLAVDGVWGFGLFNVQPHPMDPSQNPLFPSLAVDKTKDRIYWWSTGATYTAFGDSQAVYFTDDEGVNWDSTEIVWDMTNTASYWSGSAIAISNDDSNLAVWQVYGEVPLDGDTVNCVLYSRTEDEGNTWEITCVIQVGVSWNGLSDPIITPFGYNDTLIIHAARGVDLGFDYQNNVHMVMNGLAYHAINDSETVNTTGIYHYSSLRGEGASNLVEITDANISHAAFIDSAINIIEPRWTSNGAGFNMPTIASAKDAPVHFALWVQWNGADEGNLAALIADTGATGFFTSAIWGAWSFDGGNSWASPYEVASVPGASLEFVTLDPWLQKIDSTGLYRWHALWLEDLSPGVSLFGQDDSSMNPWIYGTETLRYIEVAVEGEIAIIDKFVLTDNYPNPFNPITTIAYSLPRSGDVTLIIYNLLGEEVARLVDGFQQAGEYQTEWNASNVSSGIYFYRLQVGDFTETKKMVLLK